MRVVRLADGHVDLDAERVERGALSHKLTTLEARLLSYLVEHGGDVPRAELQAEVWGYAAQVRTRAIDNTIRRLRSKIEQAPKDPRHILTVHGVGYRFVAFADEPADAPPPSSMRPVTTNVSRAQGSSFVGRHREHAALRQAFAGGVRLVTLLGPAGAGKTTLARRYGAERGPDAHTLFCDLSTARSQDELEEVVAHALGVTLSGTRAQAHKRLLKALGRPGLLLICDNFEQLTAHATSTVGRWLQACDALCVLVTSRAPLGLSGEQRIELGPLSEAEAIALFRQRAQTAAEVRAAAGAQTTDEALIAQIVARLDRIPLALELAAAGTGIMALPELLARLDQPLAGMQATLDASWQTLSDEERRALARCSVFRGGFSLAAAEAVLMSDGKQNEDEPDAVGLLDALRHKSLLTVRMQYGLARFHLLMIVRSWADTKLSTGEQRHAELAHAQFYLDELFAGSDHDLEQLAAEHANLTAIRERFASSEQAVRATLCLDPLWYARGPSPMHMAALDEAVAASATPALKVRCLISRAEAWGALGDVRAAEQDAQRAGEHADSDTLHAQVWLTQGNILRRQARYTEARAAYDRALNSAANSVTRAHVLRRLAACDTEQNDMPMAQQRYREALAAYREAGDERGSAAVLGMQGNIHSERGQLAQAVRCFQAAISSQRKLGNRRRLAIVQSNLAVVQHEGGRLELARRSWQQSLAIHQQVVNRRFEAFALGGLGVLDHEEGRLDRARVRYHAALELCREIGEQRWEGISAARLATTEDDGIAMRRALDEVAEVDPGAIDILRGFAELADARRAHADGHLLAARTAIEHAHAILQNAATDSSFQRISARLLTAAIARHSSIS